MISRRDQRKETDFCVGSPDTLPRTAGRAQCSKCGEKGHLYRACRRQKDGGKHESVAMRQSLASPDEEYWAVLTQWKTAGMLVESDCTDHIVTSNDAFLEFVPIK